MSRIRLRVFNPPDEDQFEEYLEVVQGANEAGFHTLDEIAEYCLTSNITMANGNNYQKSNYRAVLGNLGRLGFIVEDDGQAQLRDICKQYVNGEFKPSSSEKGGEQLPLFGILFLECMQGMGIENIDPYIVDQLAYYFDTIRKEDATVQWSNSDILAKTAEKRADLNAEISHLSAKIDKASAQSASLKSEVGAAQAALAELAKQQADMDKVQEAHGSVRFGSVCVGAGSSWGCSPAGSVHTGSGSYRFWFIPVHV